MVPLRLSTAFVSGHQAEPLCPFFTLSGGFLLWNFMLSAQKHLASLKYTSWSHVHLCQLVAFAIWVYCCFHTLQKYRELSQADFWTAEGSLHNEAIKGFQRDKSARQEQNCGHHRTLAGKLDMQTTTCYIVLGCVGPMVQQTYVNIHLPATERSSLSRARNWRFPVDRIYQKPCRTTRSLFINGPVVHSKNQERETQNFKNPRL